MIRLHTFFYVLLGTAAAFSATPTSRIGNWGPSYQGVPGGIPSRTTIFQTVSCPTNGLSDCYTTIQTAINSCPSGQVVKLLPGVHRLDTVLSLTPGQVLRGAGSGTNASDTILMVNGGYAGAMGIQAQVDSFPSGTPISFTGGSRGASNITLTSATGFMVGYLLTLRAYPARTNEHMTVYGPVDVSGGSFNVNEHRHGWSQLCRITAVAGNQVTFWPPLVDDFTNAPTAMYYNAAYSGIGIEDLCVSFRGLSGEGLDGFAGIFMVQNYGSWIKNVRIVNAKRRGIYLTKTLLCTLQQVFMDGCQNPGPNHESIDLAAEVTGVLVEDWIAERQFPSICLGDGDFGVMGNAILYGYSTKSDSGSSQAGPDIDLNHGVANGWNLCEGNIVEKIEGDCYYGPSFYNMIYRNWSSGNNPLVALNQLRFAIQLDRWSFYYSMGANVLGTNSPALDLYEETGESGNESAVFRLGYPNMGNNGYAVGGYYTDPNMPDFFWPGPVRYGPTTATATATTNIQGNFTGIISGATVGFQDPSSTNDYVYATAYAAGTSTNILLTSAITRASGSYAYSFDAQNSTSSSSHQRNVGLVKSSLLRAGNYDYKRATTDSDASWDTFPDSLYYTSTPSWWPYSTSTLRFPSVQPASGTKVTMNPAMLRYLGITLSEGGGGTTGTRQFSSGKFSISGKSTIQ